MVKVENIPPYLKANAKWCDWRYENRDSGTTKVPYNPMTNTHASVKIPSTFTDFDSAKQKSSNADSFLRLVKTYTDIKELNAEIIRIFIEKIYVYGNDKLWDRNTKKIKVVFKFIGEVHIPSNVKYRHSRLLRLCRYFTGLQIPY